MCIGMSWYYPSDGQKKALHVVEVQMYIPKPKTVSHCQYSVPIGLA